MINTEAVSLRFIAYVFLHLLLLLAVQGDVVLDGHLENSLDQAACAYRLQVFSARRPRLGLAALLGFEHYRRDVLLQQREVPVLNEVVGRVCHHFAGHLKRHIVPRQPRQIPVLQVRLELADLQEVLDPDVVVVDSWVHFLVVFVDGMGRRVEPPIAKVEPAHQCHFLVCDYDFLVVAPQLGQNLVRVPLDCYNRLVFFFVRLLEI